MQNPPEGPRAEKKKRPRLRLPFEKRKTDFGTWSYHHRWGLLITVMTCLVFAIVAVSASIRIGGRSVVEGIMLSLPPEEIVEEEKPKPVERMLPQDLGEVSNRLSNANAELNPDLRDDRNTDASALYEEAGKIGDRMKANREAYEAGLRKTQEMIDASRNEGTDRGEQKQNVKREGRVTVEFSFRNPDRSTFDYEVPAYTCEGSGVVVLNVTLDNNGYVSSQDVDKGSFATSDDCMRAAAIKAARNTRFNLDTKAPVRHRGTITYTFVPQ